MSRDGVTLASLTYDEIGRVKTVTDTDNLTTGYRYNNLDRVTKVTYPDGTYEATDYVCCGLPGAVTDRSGRKSYYDYDAMKRVARVQDAAGHSISVERDAEGNVLRLLDARGNATRWTYDAVGRVTRKQYADGKTDEYVYAQGLLSQSRNPRGAVTNYSYDDDGNMTLVDYATTPDVGLVYDALDRVSSVTDALGTTSYAYDVLSRTSSVDGPFAIDTVSYTYDSVGRDSGMSVGNSDGTSFNTSYGYDGLDRASTLSSPVGTWSAAYVGNTEMASSVLAPNGTRSEYSHDALQRLTQVQNKTSTNAILSQYSYTIDNAKSIRTAIQEVQGANPQRNASYGYDAIDQLKSETQTEATTPASTRNATLSYDAMGNRTARTLSQSVNGGATSTTSVLSTHNNVNQLTAQSVSVNGGAALVTALSYDASGNVTAQTQNSGGSTYTYDDAERLTSLVQKDVTTGAFTKKSEYVYDGSSRKVISREYSWVSGAWVKESEVRRVYDGMDVVQERDGNSVTKVNYTRSGNIGGLLARSDTSGNYFFSYDGSGNVVGLTNASQQSVAEYAYDAWGNTLRATGAMASVNAYRYSTKELQASSGLYNYGFRFYSPSLGRWINRDPIRESGGLNLYGFVQNRPNTLIDSYGLYTASIGYGAGGTIRDILYIGVEVKVGFSWDPINGYTGGGVVWGPSAGIGLGNGGSAGAFVEVTGAERYRDLTGDGVEVGFAKGPASAAVVKGGTYWGGRIGLPGTGPSYGGEGHVSGGNTKPIVLWDGLPKSIHTQYELQCRMFMTDEQILDYEERKHASGPP